MSDASDIVTAETWPRPRPRPRRMHRALLPGSHQNTWPCVDPHDRSHRLALPPSHPIPHSDTHPPQCTPLPNFSVLSTPNPPPTRCKPLIGLQLQQPLPLPVTFPGPLFSRHLDDARGASVNLNTTGRNVPEQTGSRERALSSGPFGLMAIATPSTPLTAIER